MAFHPSKDGPTSDSSQDSGKVAGQIDLLTLTACIDTQHSPVWTDSCEFSLRMTKSANHVQLLKWLRSSMDRFALVLSTNSGTWKKRHIFSQRKPPCLSRKVMSDGTCWGFIPTPQWSEMLPLCLNLPFPSVQYAKPFETRTKSEYKVLHTCFKSRRSCLTEVLLYSCHSLRDHQENNKVVWHQAINRYK